MDHRWTKAADYALDLHHGGDLGPEMATDTSEDVRVGPPVLTEIEKLVQYRTPTGCYLRRTFGAFGANWIPLSYKSSLLQFRRL